MNTRRTWRERLHIQHTAGASSSYLLRRSTLSTPRGDQETRSYSGTIRSRPTDWLDLGAQVARRATRYNGSRDEAIGGGPHASVSLATPAGGRLTASGAYGAERRTRIGVPGGVIDIVDELHRVDETRSFLLDHPSVDRSSILVRNEREGIIYTAELEYRVVTVGDLTEIVILPGVRIEPGESLLVSYRYRLTEMPSGSVTTGRYGLSFSLGGVTVRHARSIRDSQRENGEALVGFSTFDETSNRLSVDWKLWFVRFDLDAQLRERASSAFDYRTSEISSSLAFPFWRGLQLSLGGSARRTRDGSGELTARTGYGTLLWAPHPRVQLHSKIQVLELDLAEASIDRTLGGYVNLAVTAGQLEGSLRFEYDRRIEPRDYSGGRVYLRLVRRL